MDEITTTPEVKEELTSEPEAEVAEPSVAELHKEVETRKPTEVPLSRLNKEIQRRKELESELKELKAQLNDDPDVDDVDAEPEVKSLAQRLEQIESRERRAKLEETFKTHFNSALENAPEYKDIVNIDVIKELAFNPANANKTYKQLLEMAYGNAVTGRRTIETTTPRGGAKDTKLDIDRARKDTEYRREVLADPELRKQYNEGLEKRIML